MATIDARCKLLGQAGALPQVRVYSGAPITSQPSGKSVLKVHQRFLSAVRICLLPQPCDSLSGSQMRAQQRCRKASCAAPLYQQSVPSFPHGCCLYLCQPALSLYIYTYIFYNLLGRKEKNKNKRKGLLCYQLSLPPWLCTCSSAPFQEWRRKWFYYIVTFSLNSPCEAVVLTANPSIAGTAGTVKTHTWGRRLFTDGSNTSKTARIRMF